MELKKLSKILIKNFSTLIIITLLGAILTSSFNLMMQDRYKLIGFLELGSDGYQDTDDYKYDNYYRIETGKRLIRSAEQWTKDKVLIKEIFNKANLNKAEKNNIKNNIKAVQVSDTTLRIEIEANKKTLLKKIKPYISEALQERLNIVNDDTDIIYTITLASAIIEKKSYALWIMSLAGGLVGLWLGILWLVLKYYFKKI